MSAAPVHVCVRLRTGAGACQHRGCGVTHSCTAGHSFSAGSCCTVSRWHSWRKSLAPDNGCCCCCTLSLWPPCPSPSLSAALFLGSYPAEEQEKQTHRVVFVCKSVCSLSLWLGMTMHNHAKGRIYNKVCVGRLMTMMIRFLH